MRTVLLVGFLLVLVGFVAVLWMAGGRQRPRVDSPPVVRIPGVTAPPRAQPGELTVVSWNIAWGYGWGSEGSGGAKAEAHFEETLEEMGRVLKTLAPDIVLLQEVDFDADRSHRMDQAEVLARAADLPYVAKAVSWDANYIPFPYWPPQDHFGAMRSGGAILSRFPLEEHRVETVSKPKANPWWYNLFYLFRYHQQVVAQTEHGPVLLFNMHLEAFDQDNRLRHARLVAERLAGVITPHTVVAGDLNSVLPEATVRSGYPDEPETSHVEDATVEVLRGVTGLVDALPGPQYLSNEPAWFTFPAHEPNRKLDYILHGAGYEVAEISVPRGVAGDLSDHLPVVVRLVDIETSAARRLEGGATKTSTGSP